MGVEGQLHPLWNGGIDQPTRAAKLNRRDDSNAEIFSKSTRVLPDSEGATL